MKRLYGRVGRLAAVLLAVAVLLLGSSHAMAQEVNEYRQFLGIDSRKLIWFLAQMHLFFGAFVLGVPLFAVIIEVVGWRNKDARFDKLAYEFTSLLSVAYATTAALGGLLAFALFTLYPTFMGYMAGVFKDVMFVYALLFFAETFCLYLYYYGWNWLQSTVRFGQPVRWFFKGLGGVVLLLGVAFFFGLWGPDMRGDTRSFITFLYILPLGIGLVIIRDLKSSHIFIGIVLNIAGTAIMQAANSWAGFMMSPAGVDAEGVVTGSVWLAFENVLATPVAIHRMLGNLAFGGLVAGSYAAVKFIGSRTAEQKAHYDWMGYISNFVAIIALIPLPFAGYYLGREVQHDGRRLLLDFHHPGDARGVAVPDLQLLPVERHDPDPRRGALLQVYQVHPRAADHLLRHLAYAAQPSAHRAGGRADGRQPVPPDPEVPRPDAGQKRRGQPDHPVHLHQLPPVPEG
jgi:hypothetical protein